MEGKAIEEVEEYKYSGYVMSKNGGDEGQIRSLKKKANVVMKQVWELGEHRFRDDFRKRMMLLKYLMLGIMTYGAEVWGSKEREELERVQKNIQWTLNFDFCTPRYIIYKETGIERVSTIAGCRAVKFEDKAIIEGDRKLVVKCVKDKEKERCKVQEREDREDFYRQNGFSSEGVKMLREREIDISAIIKQKELERLGQWIYCKMRNSKYNAKYRNIVVRETEIFEG